MNSINMKNEWINSYQKPKKSHSIGKIYVYLHHEKMSTA
jgi:hypothetical protein